MPCCPIRLVSGPGHTSTNQRTCTHPRSMRAPAHPATMTMDGPKKACFRTWAMLSSSSTAGTKQSRCAHTSSTPRVLDTPKMRSALWCAMTASPTNRRNWISMPSSSSSPFKTVLALEYQTKKFDRRIYTCHNSCATQTLKACPAQNTKAKHIQTQTPPYPRHVHHHRLWCRHHRQRLHPANNTQPLTANPPTINILRSINPPTTSIQLFGY